eukprot:gene8661-608_t
MTKTLSYLTVLSAIVFNIFEYSILEKENQWLVHYKGFFWLFYKFQTLKVIFHHNKICALFSDFFIEFLADIIFNEYYKVLDEYALGFHTNKILLESIDGYIIKVNPTLNIEYINQDFFNIPKEEMFGTVLSDYPFYQKEVFDEILKTKKQKNWEWSCNINGEKQFYSSKSTSLFQGDEFTGLIILSTISVLEIVENTLNIISARITNVNLIIDYKLDFNICSSFIGDKFRIIQILLNFITNSMKFTKEGVIELSAKPVLHESNPFVRFQVSDEGIGISSNNLSKIFTPFFQSEVDSSTPTDYKSVLLISFEQSILNNLEKTCLFMGFKTIKKFEDIVDCLKLIKKRNFDLIVLDEYFVDSVDIFQKYEKIIIIGDKNEKLDIRSLEDVKKKSTPIIAVTGNFVNDKEHQLLEWKMNEILIKPVKIDLLMNTILNIIETSMK